MNYYEVAPASAKYHGFEPLTYQSKAKLGRGQIISAGLRGHNLPAIVLKPVKKPDFTTISIDSAVDGLVLPEQSICLLEWMRDYYPGPIGIIASLFLPATLGNTKLPAEQKSGSITTKTLPKLTAEQNNILKTIKNSKDLVFLLHGVTGSGKTRIYIELAKKCLAEGKSAIILTPEISLTPQLIDSFQKVFGDSALVTHSGLTPKKRQEIWLECRTGNKPKIIIGPRSALFMPLNNIGLIVVDEMHEPAYKQESMPHYHAIRVAAKLASFSQARLIMGSATPTISEYFIAEQKNIPILEMNRLAIAKRGANKPAYSIVDLSDPGELSGQPLISKSLITELGRCLKGKHQALVFLNKRGSSRYILCRACGWQARCAACDLSLAYHADSNSLRCHTCGRTYKLPLACPDCKSVEIVFKSPGTKAIAASLEKLFPDAAVARFDRDNKKAERIDSRYSEVISGDIDILVGTQILAKGHDLPRLGLVAMILADSSLQFPDYTSEERTYQLIKQLSGRVGRGHKAGKVVLQTFNPDSPLVQSAIDGKWQDFYQSQIAQRQKFGFPPFYYAMKIVASKALEATARQAVQKIANQISDLPVLGPSPSFHKKSAGKYHWQIIVKSKNRQQLADLAREIPGGYKTDIDPQNLL